MALKGETVIELTDVNTGAVEVHRDTNMVTNALQEIIKPIGYIKDGAYLMGFNGQSSPFNRFYWNALGGILLFDKSLPESKDTLFPPDGTSLVACGSRSMTNMSTTNKCRGNYNTTESVFSESERKMKFVYDFSTDKGNGKISSVALTSWLGGLTGWGHSTTGNVTSAGITDLRITNRGGTNFNDIKRTFVLTNGYQIPFLIDPENDLSYEISIKSSKEVVITKKHLNINSFSIFLNSYTQHPTIEQTIINLTTGFSSTSSDVKFYMNYDNITKSLYVLLSNNDISVGSNFSILKIEIPSLQYNIISLTNSSNKKLISRSVAFNGEYMYIFSSVSNNLTNLYKINTTTNQLECIQENYNCENSIPTFFVQLNDRIIYKRYAWIRYSYTGTSYTDSSSYYSYFVLNNDSIYRTEYQVDYDDGSMMIPVFNNPLFFLSVSGSSYVSGSNVMRYSYYTYVIISNYLATINNLTTPVYKTADTTMKVTYTIQETNYM